MSEFPIAQLEFSVPEWVWSLPLGHRLITEINEMVRSAASKVTKISDVAEQLADFQSNEIVDTVTINEINMGNGCVKLTINVKKNLLYAILKEESGFEIESENDLLPLLIDLSKIKQKYNKVEEALNDVNERGYGIVMPDVSELRLEEPEIVRKQNGYGVKLCASAQSIHMIRANIETEINPMVGSEQQSEDLVKYLLHEFEESPSSIWESNIFGKSLYELVNEGLHAKLEHMPDDARTKLSETLERIVNEGSGGLICILL